MTMHNFHFLIKEMDTSILYDDIFMYMLNLLLASLKYIKLLAYKTLYGLVFLVVKSEYSLACTCDIYACATYIYA